MPTAETQKTSLEVFFLRGRTTAQLPLCEGTSILLVIIPSRACELTRAIYTRSRTRGGAGCGGGRQRERTSEYPAVAPSYSLACPKDVAPGTEKRAGALRAQGVDSSMP